MSEHRKSTTVAPEFFTYGFRMRCFVTGPISTEKKFSHFRKDFFKVVSHTSNLIVTTFQKYSFKLKP